MKKILMLTDQDGKDFVSGDLAGLGMRIWSLAKLFRKAGAVTIGLSRDGTEWEKDGVKGIPILRRPDWKNRCFDYDVVYILQSSKLESVGYRFAASKLSIFTVVDCYTPLVFEKLTYVDSSDDPQLRILEAEAVIRIILKQGDLFLCASRPQADYLLGALTSLGVGWDPEIVCWRTMEEVKWIKHKILKPKVVWFGGVYPWMDIEPVFEAMYEVFLKLPTAELIVVGAKFKERLGFEDKWDSLAKNIPANFARRVKIIDWVRFNKISETLKESGLAINWAKKTPEDRLAYRSRIMSVLKRGIPVVTNGSDELSELIGYFDAGVRLDQPERLGREISKLLRNQGKLRKMSDQTKLLVKYLEKQSKSAEVKLLDLIQNGRRIRHSPVYLSTLMKLLVKKLVNKF